jgi:hypothetical protein
MTPTLKQILEGICSIGIAALNDSTLKFHDPDLYYFVKDRLVEINRKLRDLE